jgi:hypothetical protein
MRRAIPLLALAILAVTLDTPRALAAVSTTMNGIGLVDYRHKPTFKVGDWARYRMQARSELGMTDDYTLTVLIAGEEDFWGDPAFWIETWVDVPNRPPQTQASLMSYEIFGDSVATQRLLLYTRKMITTLNEDGTPKMDINKPAASTLRQRREVMNPAHYDIDTLGVDTVQTPKGELKALKILTKEGKGVTQAVGDSSVYTEVRENRTSWYAMEVPITHLAREDIESINARKSWMVGRSGDASTLNIRDRGLGSARLVDFGHGLEARLLPERLRHSIAEQLAAERGGAGHPAKPGPTARPRAPKPAGHPPGHTPGHTP